MTTTNDTPASASDRAMHWLQEEVVSLPWHQELFLSESEIARKSGVSRTPVREALLQLENGGLLRRIPFKGAYIPALTQADIDEIMEVRTVIGQWATTKVATKHPGIGGKLLEIIQQQRDAQDDLLRFIELDVHFHRTIVHAAANPTLERLYQSQRFKQQRLGLQAVMAEQGRTASVLTEHTAMAEAIRDGDPERAGTAAVEHVTSTSRLLWGR
jgi:DNA-binding GntR family transcriptional regulator